MKKNVFEIVTEKIIELLEKGVVPWRKPWKGGVGAPRNLISNKPYRGINAFLLGVCSYSSRYWLTFKQARELGGLIKAGERASLVVFYKKLSEKKEDQEQFEAGGRDYFILRYYRVFNVEQVEGISHKRLQEEKESIENLAEFNSIETCENFWAGYSDRPRLEHEQQRAFYRPAQDLINMPIKTSFDSEREYYCTLFHEMIHSTGHFARLNRKGIAELSSFGGHEYSKEELIAEMGAAMLCAEAGIENSTIENSAAYISNWLTALKQKSNFRLVVDAASAAQKAIDLILNEACEAEEEE